MNDSVNYYYNHSVFEPGIVLGVKALDKANAEFGEFSSNYTSSLNILGLLYFTTAQYKKADTLFTRLVEIDKTLLGEKNINYATDLNNLALLYKATGQYENAEALFITANEIIKNSVGKIDARYAASLNNLAEYYRSTGQYEKAEPKLIEAVDINKKILGENSVAYAVGLNNLAVLCLSWGRYEKAESLFLKAKDIVQKAVGEDHPDFATNINNLAEFYRSMGYYEQAEELFIRARDIRKKIFGEAHPAYAQSLNNLATLYRDIGQYEKAELLYIQAKEIRKKTLGEDDPSYATTVYDLGGLYFDMRRYEESEPLLVQAKEIRGKKLGFQHSDYVSSLNSLALLYKNLGQHEKAESLYLDAKEITKISFGENHPAYAVVLNNLAAFYKSLNQYAKAESLYLRAKDINKESLGENHPNYLVCLDNLGFLYGDMNRYVEAEKFFSEERNTVLKNSISVLNSLSEKEKGNYVAHNLFLNNCDNSFIHSYPEASPLFYCENYNLQLFLKSLSLTSTRSVIDAVESSNDTTLHNVFYRWKRNKSLLSKQYAIPVANRSTDLKQMEDQTEELEKELTRRSSSFRQQQQNLQIKIADIQKRLGPDEAAIEFVNFRLYEKKWTDSMIYAAYVLRKNDQAPIFVPLCEEKQLSGFLTGSTNSPGNVKALYRSEPIDEGPVSYAPGDSVYSLVWKPLLPFLSGINKISYSPSGLLNRVAFQALQTPDSQLLIDKYELNQYISTRQLAIDEPESKNKKNSIVLFGDCAFTLDSPFLIKNIPATHEVSNIYSENVNRSENKGSWQQLDGTASEINQIKKLFGENKIDTISFSQQRATEERLKSLSGNSPKILHLATHGFFLPDPVQKKKQEFEGSTTNTFKLSDDPMMRSGIILAGANRVWSGLPPIDGIEDGIVTAYEIAQLDLRNTDLVVLSACETALGDIRGTEGVFGLQRGFKLAGVKSLLLSLWKVPDKETSELMTAFYRYYINGNSARVALRKAQMEMKQKYRPYYWAAFVLVE
jgi:CHAT domain-containing protein/tetratricopeptide (TPR) repeat protein